MATQEERQKDEVYLRLLKATKPIAESAKEIEPLAETIKSDKRFPRMLKIVRDHVCVTIAALNVGLSKEERETGEAFSKGENFKLLEPSWVNYVNSSLLRLKYGQRIGVFGC